MVWDSYQNENCVQLVDIFKGLIPTFITTEANAKNQEPTQNVHIAQYFDVLNLQKGLKTKESFMGKLIPV
jgi:hypothetical protein